MNGSEPIHLSASILPQDILWLDLSNPEKPIVGIRSEIQKSLHAPIALSHLEYAETILQNLNERMVKCGEGFYLHFDEHIQEISENKIHLAGEQEPILMPKNFELKSLVQAKTHHTYDPNITYGSRAFSAEVAQVKPADLIILRDSLKISSYHVLDPKNIVSVSSLSSEEQIIFGTFINTTGMEYSVNTAGRNDSTGNYMDFIQQVSSEPFIQVNDRTCVNPMFVKIIMQEGNAIKYDPNGLHRINMKGDHNLSYIVEEAFVPKLREVVGHLFFDRQRILPSP